ncbi:DUF5808 domain-containing protein [Clostridiaceae bacterium M8S5]|nr:DUF5808 domain-containing protein [Clostridiaceae bacterium M8S5]
MNTIDTVMDWTIYIIVAITLIMTPLIGRKDVVFGVTIPTDQKKTKEIVGFKKLYIKLSMLSAIIITLGAVLLNFLVKNKLSIYNISAMLYLVSIFVIYSIVNKKVKGYKKTKNWAKEARNIRVVDIEFISSKLVCSVWCFLIHIAMIVATGISAILLYEDAPSKLPIKVNMSGHITKYIDKSIIAVLFPIIIQIAILVTCLIIYMTIKHTPPYIDPDNIEISKKHAKLHKKAWSYFTVIFGLLLIGQFSLVELGLFNLIQVKTGFIIGGIVTIFLIALTLFLSIKVGHSGGHKKGVNSAVINRDDDKHWISGKFYYNKNDASLFVEKRFGVGYTINFAKPLAILMICGLLTFIIGCSLIGTLL